MRTTLILLVALISVTFSLSAQSPKKDPASRPVDIVIVSKDGGATIHRSPVRVDIEVYYNPATCTVDISATGDQEGVVTLYHDGSVIGYSSEINCSIQLPELAGSCQIEIVGSSWIAIGTIQL